MTTGLRLSVLPFRIAVCRLPASSALPGEALSGAFFSVTRTKEELSLVVPAEFAPAEARIESGWRILCVAGPLAFSLTGILASLAAPLAEAEIPLFAISTFDTDYVLVKEERLEDALSTLRSKGHVIEE